MDLVSQMDSEQQRNVREGFSCDEELSLYDMLFSDNLSKLDIQAIKKVAVDLLTRIKEKISELGHWTDKSEAKAIVDNLIRDLCGKNSRHVMMKCGFPHTDNEFMSMFITDTEKLHKVSLAMNENHKI